MSIEVILPPFVITDNDKRGLVVVITVTLLSFVWTCLLVRIWMRLNSREWKSDDFFLAAVTVRFNILAQISQQQLTPNRY